MQSKTSFFNLALFKKNLSRTWMLGLVYLVYELLVVSGNFVVSTSAQSRWVEGGLTKTDISYWLVTVLEAGDNTIILGIMSIAAVLATFRYLFVKKDSYMIHAFPVSRQSLFVTGCVSSFLLFVIPQLIVAIVTTVCAIAKGAGYIHFIWAWFFARIASDLFYLGLAIFSAMLTGQFATAVLFYFMFNFLYVGMQIAVYTTMSVMLFGLTNLFDMIELNFLTPLAYMGEYKGLMVENKYDKAGDHIQTLNCYFDGANYYIVYAVVGILLAAAAMALYKKKQIETVNDFIAYKPVKLIFNVGVAFFVSLVLASGLANVLQSSYGFGYSTMIVILFISFIVIGIILYFCVRMLVEKNIRVFTKKNLRYCAIYSCVALVALLTIKIDIYGVEKKVPLAEELEWAGLSHEFITIYQGEDIEKVINFHKDILANKNEMQKYYYDEDETSGLYVEIKYKYKNGRTMIRSYYLEDENSDNRSQQYKAMANSFLKMVNDPDTILKSKICPDYESFVPDNGTLTAGSKLENGRTEWKDWEDHLSMSAPKRAEFIDELYVAAVQDIKEGNLCTVSFGGNDGDIQYYNDISFFAEMDTPYYGYDDIYYGYGDRYDYNRYVDFYTEINKNCVNILNVLKKYDKDAMDYLVTYDELDEF